MKTKNLLGVGALFFMIGSSAVDGWPMENEGTTSSHGKASSEVLRRTGELKGEPDLQPERGKKVMAQDPSITSSSSEDPSSDEESFDNEGIWREVSDAAISAERILAAKKSKQQSEEDLLSLINSPLEKQQLLKEEAKKTLQYWQIQNDAYTSLLNEVDQAAEVIEACQEAMEAAKRVVEANDQAYEVKSDAEQAIVFSLKGEEEIVDKEAVTLTLPQRERLQQGIESFLENARRAQKDIRRAILKFVQTGEKNLEQHAAVIERKRKQEEELKAAEENLLQVQEENNEENRANTRLAQLSRFAQVAGPQIKRGGAVVTVVGGSIIFTPLAPLAPVIIIGGKALRMAGGELEKAAPVLEEANKKMGEYEVTKAIAHRDHMQEELSHAKKKIEEARDQLLQQEAQRKEQERSLFTGACSVISLFAKQVCPRREWNDHEWMQWIATMLQCDHSSEEIISFLVPCQENFEYLKKATAAAWERHLDDGYMQWRLLESKSAKKLRRFSNEYKKVVKRFEIVKGKREALLKQEESNQEWQPQLEALVRGSEDARELGTTSEAYQKYLHNIEELKSLQQQHEAYPSKEQELQKQLEKIKVAEQAALKMLTSKTTKYQLQVALAQAGFRTDQEQFRRYWPDHDVTFRSYLEWELPFPVEAPASSQSETLLATQPPTIESPIMAQAEREAKGRHYLAQAKKAIEAAFSSTTAKDSATSATTAPAQKVITSVVPDDSLAETLEAWSLKQIYVPEAAEKERWAARRKYDQCRKQSRELSQLLQQENDEKEETETGTISSWRPSVKPRSVFSFLKGGTKSTMTGASIIADPQIFDTRFSQAREEEKRALEQWQGLVKNAEQVRKNQELLTKGEPVLENEIAELDATTIDAWAAADRTAGQAWERREHLLQEKKWSKDREKSWDQNNQRWRAMDDLLTAEKELREETDKKKEAEKNLTAQRGLKDSARIAAEVNIAIKFDQPLVALKEKVRTAKAAWETLAKQHEHILPQDNLSPEAEETLKSFDEAVLSRWDQCLESLGPVDPETAAAKKMELSQQKWKEESIDGAVLTDDAHAQKYFLDRIEGIWKSILTAQQEAKFHHAKEAAREHHQGDPTLWNNLSEEARQEYNDQIKKENERYDQEFAEEETWLENVAQQLEQEQKKAEQFFSALIGRGKKKLDDLKELKTFYKECYQELVKREEALRFGGMTKEERERNLQEKINLLDWVNQLPRWEQEARDNALEAERIAKQDEERFSPIYVHDQKRIQQKLVADLAEKVGNHRHSASSWRYREENIVHYSKKRAEALRKIVLIYEEMSRKILEGRDLIIKKYKKLIQIEEYKAEKYAFGKEAYKKKEKENDVPNKPGLAALEEAASSCEKAIEMEWKGTRMAWKIAEAYYLSVFAYASKAEALFQGNPEQAEFAEEVATLCKGEYLYGKRRRANPGAIWAYEEAIRHAGIRYAPIRQEENNKAVQAYQKSGDAFKNAVKAFLNGNTRKATLYKMIGNLLGGYEVNPGAGWAYSRSRGINIFINNFQKMGEHYEVMASYVDAALKALAKGETEKAKLYESRAAIEADIFSLENKSEKYSKAKAAYIKSREVLDEALKGGLGNAAQEQERLERLGRSAAIFKEVGTFYNKAASSFHTQKNKAVEEAYQEAAKTLEEKVKAFENKDAKRVELCEERVKALSKFVDYELYNKSQNFFERVVMVPLDDDPDGPAVEKYFQAAALLKQALEVQGDEEAIERYQREAKQLVEML